MINYIKRSKQMDYIKELKVISKGMDTKIYINGQEVKGVKNFMICGAENELPSINIERYITGDIKAKSNE